MYGQDDAASSSATSPQRRARRLLPHAVAMAGLASSLLLTALFFSEALVGSIVGAGAAIATDMKGWIPGLVVGAISPSYSWVVPLSAMAALLVSFSMMQGRYLVPSLLAILLVATLANGARELFR